MSRNVFNMTGKHTLKPPLQNVKRVQLSNKLPLIVKEDHSIPLVAIFLWVKVGSLNEPDELAGVSHFLEHMLFKGTKKRAVGDFAREIKGAGGYLNAFTSYDATCYFVVLPSDHLELGLESQVDAFLNSTFDQKEHEKEMKVILEEINARYDNPEIIVWEKLMATSFTTHRYRRPIIGEESVTSQLSSNDLVKYYEDYYCPENTLVVVTGDVDIDALAPLAEKYFGNYTRKSKQMNMSPPEPDQQQHRFVNIQGDIMQKYINLGFHIPPFLHDDAIALEIISGILTDGKSSRLFQTLREEKRLVTSISSGSLTGLEPGVFIINATMDESSILENVEAIFIELERLKYQPVPESEFKKIKVNIEKSFYHDMETVEGVARKLAEFEHLGDYRFIDQYIEKLKSINASDVMRVAEKYFTGSNCSTVVYIPKTCQDENNLDTTKLVETIQNVANSSVIQFKKTGPVKSSPYNVAKTNEYTFVELTEGLGLVHKKRTAVPLVSMGAFILGGLKNEVPDINGISCLTQKLMLKGTSTRSFKTLVNDMESIGGNLTPIVGKDITGLFLTILSRNFKNGVAMFGDLCHNASFQSEQVDKEKEITIAQIQQENDNLMRLCIINLYKTLFKNHPYGLNILGTKNTVKNLQRDQLVQWYQDKFVHNNIIISVVGDVSRNTVVNALEKYFAGMPRKVIDSKPTPLPPLKGIQSIVDIRDKKQTSIAVGFRFPSVKHPDYFAISVMEEILSGMGGRLFINLRDRNYLGYVVHGYFDSCYDASSFWVFMGVPPEREEEALQKMFAELEQLKTTPVNNKELSDAKSALIGNRLIDLQNNSALVLEYAKREMLGQRSLSEEKLIQQIQRVQPEDITKIANKYFDINNYAISIIRPRD